MERDTEELLKRGASEIIGEAELLKKLSEGKTLRVKLGIDPTSPDLHIGRAVSLLKLRDFQKLGHTAVLIVGDFTGIIGDTSDKDSERPMLTKEEIEEYKKTYFEQVGKLIDLDKAELHQNSEWLEPLTYREIGEQADCFSVSDFIARDNIARRLEAGKRVSLREVLYPLMQGYDSVAIKADVELGGTDQRFNLLAGRALQEKYGQEPQSLVMNPLIDGLDGRKMSSSWGNTVTLNAEPNNMYGKVMSMSDAEIPTYFELCTRVPLDQVKNIIETYHPKDAKMFLAKTIVTMYHGVEASEAAEQNFINTFSKKGLPSEIPVSRVPVGSKYSSILLEAGLVKSNAEWRRLVEEGAVSNAENQESISSPDEVATSPVVLKVGKLRFIKIEII